MARISVVATQDNVPQVMSWINSLKKITLFVGVTHDQREEGRIGNIALANILENGAPSSNIPARPFTAPAMRRMKKEITKSLKAAALALSENDKKKARLILEKLGGACVDSIRAKIESDIPPPHAESSIAANRGVDWPTLIVTGQLEESIGYTIKGI